MEKENLVELRTRVGELIAAAVREAEAREGEERNRGTILLDGPVARLMAPPQPVREYRPTSIPPGSETCEVAQLEDGLGAPVDRLLFYGTTQYLESRRQWKAYREAVLLAHELGFADDRPLYEPFSYVATVMTFVTRKEIEQEFILVGVRSPYLAGTHPGALSVPAGVMHPGETLRTATRRELTEECGIEPASFSTAAVPVRNPDAPSITFCLRVWTEQRKVRETVEAHGKTFIWVSVRDCLRPALTGDMGPMARMLSSREIEVPKDLRFAPDAREGLLDFGFGR